MEIHIDLVLLKTKNSEKSSSKQLKSNQIINIIVEWSRSGCLSRYVALLWEAQLYCGIVHSALMATLCKYTCRKLTHCSAVTQGADKSFMDSNEILILEERKKSERE